MKNELKELENKMENIGITYDYEETYKNLYNTCMDFENETQCFEFETLFEDIVDYEIAEERAKYELENGGLIRLYYFMGNCNFNNEIFRINAYSNLEDINKDDLECLKQEIIEKIEELSPLAPLHNPAAVVVTIKASTVHKSSTP